MGYNGVSLQIDSMRASSDDPCIKPNKKQNEIVGMGSGKSEQRFGEFQPFILHHIGIFVFDILQKSKQQINFLFIER